MASMRPSLHRTATIVVGTVLLVGCTPQPATVEAQDVSWLYGVFMVAAAVVFVITAGLIGWSVVRYRAREGDDALPAQTNSNVALEIVWWLLPTLLVAGLFVLSAGVMAREDAGANGSALQIRVEGFQWQWRFVYADSGVEVIGTLDHPPEMVVPVGRPVTLELTSADVIHSFYVPAFLVKRDTIPGQTNHLTITVNEAGTYRGQCAEFCGLYHAGMLFSVRAVSADEFDAWLADAGASGP